MARRKFTKEFKVEACKLVIEQGQSIAQTAKNLGLGEPLLGRWVREFRHRPTEETFPGEDAWLVPTSG